MWSLPVIHHAPALKVGQFSCRWILLSVLMPKCLMIEWTSLYIHNLKVYRMVIGFHRMLMSFIWISYLSRTQILVLALSLSPPMWPGQVYWIKGHDSRLNLNFRYTAHFIVKACLKYHSAPNIYLPTKQTCASLRSKYCIKQPAAGNCFSLIWLKPN